jgi:hypothetical protein
MIRLAFGRHPGAEQAWKNMTDKQRRHNLLAIFHYRTPASRLKRLERMIEDATEQR